jgi:hypothetical protein
LTHPNSANAPNSDSPEEMQSLGDQPLACAISICGRRGGIGAVSCPVNTRQWFWRKSGERLV